MKKGSTVPVSKCAERVSQDMCMFFLTILQSFSVLFPVGIRTVYPPAGLISLHFPQKFKNFLLKNFANKKLHATFAVPKFTG